MAPLRILGWIHAVLGGLGLTVGVVVCAGLAREPDGGRALQYIGPLFLIIAIPYLAPAFIGGVGLLRGKNWARVVIAVLSFLLLLAIPVGTALGGFGLWALATAKPAPAMAPDPIKTMPSAERRRILGVLVMAVSVGCGFIIAIGAGYRMHHQPVPAAVFGVGFYPAIAVLVATIGFLVVKQPFALDGPRSPPLNPFWLHRYRQKMKRDVALWEEERRQRIAKFRLDPATEKYANRIAAGQVWSDAQIAYDMDPERLVTCRHLQPVERAMRRADLSMKLFSQAQVEAWCLIDEPALRAAFALPASVLYKQYFMGGRSAEDDPVALLICEPCQSSIDAVHPYKADRDTPTFPAKSPEGEGR
ncbi:MAG: hypothetical protein ABIO39_02295 [Caulobacteraceae bacterium]